jgi:hypothetical protein
LFDLCSGLDEAVLEQDIRNAFYPYGEIRSITVVPKQVFIIIADFFKLSSYLKTGILRVKLQFLVRTK